MKNTSFSTKDIIHFVEKHIGDSGKSREKGLDEFLDYLLDFFSIDAYKDGQESMIKHFKAMQERSRYLYFATIAWLEVTGEKIGDGGWYDTLGHLYEELYQSRGKANALGQFYTPESVCDLMSRMQTHPDEVYSVRVNDPACGSGRTLVAEHHILKKGYYVGQDIDATSVKMCALNMMVHNMRGRAVRGDTLRDPVGFDWGYEVNEANYPFPCGCYSVRRITGKASV